MTFFRAQHRSGRPLGFAPGLVLAIWLASALMTPQRASGQGGVVSVTTVSAASYASIVSPDSIASAFGLRLATHTEAASSQPLPTSLAGTTVTVNGERARLFFVSPTQINYLIPP